MATQRYISTSFWDDEWVQTHDPSEKLFFLYLLTNPLTNIAGVYQITDRRISFDTGFNDDVVKEMWRRFTEAGKAVRVGEWVILPTWPKHQRVTERSNVRTGIDRVLLDLPVNIFNAVLKHDYCYPYLAEVVRTFKDLQGRAKTLNYSDLDLDLDPDLTRTGTRTKPNSDPDEWEDADAGANRTAATLGGPADPFEEMKRVVGK